MNHRARRAAAASIIGLLAPLALLLSSLPAAAAAVPWLRWSKPTRVDTNPVWIGSLSCPTAKFCVNIDVDSNVHVFNGKKWLAPVPLGITYVDNWAVSCPTSQWCAGVDVYGNVTYYNGTSWSKPRSIDTNDLGAISCTGFKACVAVDSQGTILQSRGYNKEHRASVTPFYYTNNVSCASARFCVAMNEGSQVIIGRAS